MNSRESFSRAGGITYSIVGTGQMIHTTSNQQVLIYDFETIHKFSVLVLFLSTFYHFVKL